MPRKPHRRPGRRIPKYIPGPGGSPPIAAGLPTERDINVFDSLDERHAVRMFLGKDLQQAQWLFRENFFHRQENLMWMGPRAFRFYLPAAISYLLSEEANDDTDAVNCFCGLLEFRLDQEPDEIAPVATILREGILRILWDFDRLCLGADDFGYLYEDLAERFRVLLSRLDACSRPK